MVTQALAEVAVGCFVDELWQGFYDLVLRVVDILQAMEQKIVHCLNVFGEQAHGGSFTLVSPVKTLSPQICSGQAQRDLKL
jgi:hypothetical protein